MCARCRRASGRASSHAIHAALPSIRFDHPAQDFAFCPQTAGARANVALVIAALPDPSWHAYTYETRQAHWGGEGWSVAIEINAQEVARWHATELMNALGEVSTHVSVPDLPPGEHTASCRLLQDAVSELDDGPEHTISFFVRDSPPPSPPPRDIWTPLLCEACAQATACGGVRMGVGKAGAECHGHGVCQGGACLCAADWAGEHCNHSLLADTAFIPRFDPVRAASRCTKSLAWGLGEEQLGQLLEANLPIDAARCEASSCDRHDSGAGAVEASGEGHCHRESGGMFLFGPPTHGLGFNVHYVSHMVAWALQVCQALCPSCMMCMQDIDAFLRKDSLPSTLLLWAAYAQAMRVACGHGSFL